MRKVSKKEHWEKVYGTKGDKDVGWFQPSPEISLQMVEKYAQSFDDSIIDIGGGNSFLIKNLFELGYLNLTVLDISKEALERSKRRFEDGGSHISWNESDILKYQPNNFHNIWHDRAVFHFLTEDLEQSKYAEVAAKNIKQNGYLILGTFSTTGPKSCSGLPIVQYTEEKLNEIFSDHFEMIECFEDIHITPSGNPQNFIWVVFKRN